MVRGVKQAQLLQSIEKLDTNLCSMLIKMQNDFF